MSEEEFLPLPQIKLVSILPFAPPVPVLEFPGIDKIEEVAMELLNLKNLPEFVELLKVSRG